MNPSVDPAAMLSGCERNDLAVQVLADSVKGRRSEAAKLFYDGNRCLQVGDFDGAENCFRAAIERVNDFAEAHANLGFVLDQKGQFENAEACFRQALQLAPDCPEVHLNLGVLLATQKRFAEAQLAYGEAIRCQPASSAAWSNLGALYIGMKQEEQAEDCLKKSLALDPANAKAIFNLSYLMLRQGRFDEGWRCLEARDWYRQLASYFTCPRWTGEPLAGKSLIMTFEAGHGDVIQFCRYAKLFKAQGTRHLTLVCHPALKRLLLTLDGVDRVMAFDEDIPQSDSDFWTPLLSAPYYCQTRADSIPADIPYLHADADLIKQWETHLPKNTLRVGLVWKGNPKFENDADRSLPSLAVLAPLWDVAGISFISLQKGAGEDEAKQMRPGLALLELGSQMTDFADAAAIVVNLDLVICVDTAMAHLTGALGKPCWVLLPDYMADWRWLSHASTSAWYPQCLRLFRQTEAGNWSLVAQELAEALALFQAHLYKTTVKICK